MLTALGHEVEGVSWRRAALRSLDETRLRTYAKAQIQAISLIQRYPHRRVRSDLRITYRPYAKALDLLGPLVATALEPPYRVITSRKDSFNLGILKFGDVDIVAEPANGPPGWRGWIERAVRPISRPRSSFRGAPSCTCD